MNEPQSIFLFPQYFILYLFIAKFIFFIICARNKHTSFFQKHALFIYKGTLISLLLLFLYLVVIRLILGWESRWLSLVYLLYFITGLFLDAFYFGLKKRKDKLDVVIFKNKLLSTAEIFIQKKNFIIGYRLIKSFYYYGSILLYVISGFFLFLIPLPTVDSFHQYKQFFCSCGDGAKPFDSYRRYFYPVEGQSDYSFYEENVMNKIIISVDQYGTTIYEKKLWLFRKHIITVNNMKFCFFKNDTPSSFDYREFSDDEDLRNQAAIDRENYYQALKMSKEKFEEWEYANLDKKHNNLDIERLYDLNRLNERETIRIKLKEKHIEIEAFCGETKIKGVQRNKQYPCSYFIKKIKR